MSQARTNKLKFSFAFVFLVLVVAVNFNILIRFFFQNNAPLCDVNHILLATVTIALTLLLRFSLFSYFRLLEKKIEENESTIEELVSKNDFFRLLSENSNDMIHFNDAGGFIKYINPVTTKLLGYEPHEMINQPAQDFIHSDDRQGIYEDMEKVVNGEDIPAREIRILKKNEEWLDVEVKGFSFSINDRQFYLGAVLRDITNRKKKEKLTRIQKEWEQTFNTMSDFVSVHDEDFTVIKVNSALCDFLNKSPEEILGKKCYQVFHGTDAPVDKCPHAQAQELNRSVTTEINDPAIGVPLQVTCSPFFSEENEFIGSVHIARRTTNRLTKFKPKRHSDKTLIPICASCKDIRTEKNSWTKVEEYIQKTYGGMFTHCICKSCQKKLYPEFTRD